MDAPLKVIDLLLRQPEKAAAMREYWQAVEKMSGQWGTQENRDAALAAFIELVADGQELAIAMLGTKDYVRTMKLKVHMPPSVPRDSGLISIEENP